MRHSIADAACALADIQFGDKTAIAIAARKTDLIEVKPMSFMALLSEEKEAAGVDPAAFSSYFWTVIAALCEPNCAVTEVLVTLALAIWLVIALLA